jgi:hypothetical protein
MIELAPVVLGLITLGVPSLAVILVLLALVFRALSKP